MGSTTDLISWPYPESTDRIAEGAANIEDLADSIQDQFFLPSSHFAAAEPHTSYPQGMSIMAVSNSIGWPYGGIVVTWVRLGSSFVTQWFTWQTSTVSAQKTQIRYGYSTGTPSAPVWTAWQTMAANGVPTASASGDATLTPPSGGGDVSAVVTLPSSRFANQDTAGKIRIFTACNSSSPTVAHSANWTSSGTITSFTLYLNRGTPTATGIHWYAIQGAA